MGTCTLTEIRADGLVAKKSSTSLSFPMSGIESQKCFSKKERREGASNKESNLKKHLYLQMWDERND